MLEHTTVFAQEGVYASHPANHGAWSRGEELLVGFLTGRYNKIAKHYHPVDEPYTKLLARSIDGGRTWRTETPNVDFECAFHTSTYLPTITEDSIFRVCGVYDTGGEYCHKQGGFYVSSDFGHTWEGAFPFKGLESVFGDGWENSSRTRVDFPYFYLSRRKWGQFGSDVPFCAKLTPDGNFEFVRWLCEDEEERAVMPAVASPYIALRMRSSPCRINLYLNGVFVGTVAKTGRHNGNPPALIWLDRTLVCAYVNRSTKKLYISALDGRGKWCPVGVRAGDNPDIGYPQLFGLPDNSGCVVYYWSDRLHGCTSIECTRFAGVW